MLIRVEVYPFRSSTMSGSALIEASVVTFNVANPPLRELEVRLPDE